MTTDQDILNKAVFMEGLKEREQDEVFSCLKQARQSERQNYHCRGCDCPRFQGQ